MHTQNVSTLLEILQQENLVYNYNFLYFSNQSSDGDNHPDGWFYQDTGANGSIGLNEDSCQIIRGNTPNTSMTFQQALHEFPRWQKKLQGQTVTAKVHLQLEKGTTVTVSLKDNIASTTQTITATNDGEYLFEVQLDINLNATKLYLTITSASPDITLIIHKAYANIGSMALETLPCIIKGIIGERKQYIATQIAPAEELSICKTAQELSANQTRLDSVLNHRFGKGANQRSMLPDTRGYFSRAWNNKSTVDPDASTRTTLGNDKLKGDLVGTGEEDIFKSHNHDLKFAPINIFINSSGIANNGLNITTSSDTKETGGAETRPINVAELYTIKWA